MNGLKAKEVARLGRQALVTVLFAGIALVSIPAMATSISNGEAAPIPQSTLGNGKIVYDQVDKAPEFPGGNSALMRWLGANIRYPFSAQMDGIQGKVVVRFVVNEDGSVSNIQIVEKVEGSLDREAWRLIKSMPNGNPARSEAARWQPTLTYPSSSSLPSRIPNPRTPLPAIDSPTVD